MISQYRYNDRILLENTFSASPRKSQDMFELIIVFFFPTENPRYQMRALCHQSKIQRPQARGNSVPAVRRCENSQPVRFPARGHQSQIQPRQTSKTAEKQPPATSEAGTGSAQNIDEKES